MQRSDPALRQESGEPITAVPVGVWAQPVGVNVTVGVPKYRPPFVIVTPVTTPPEMVAVPVAVVEPAENATVAALQPDPPLFVRVTEPTLHSRWPDSPCADCA